MKIALFLDDTKWGWLLTKENGDQAKAEANCTDKVNEYLDACGRDVGADDMAKVTQAIANPANLAVAKAALGL